MKDDVCQSKYLIDTVLYLAHFNTNHGESIKQNLILSIYFRTYKRKTDRKTCTEQMLQTAKIKINNGFSIRSIAKDLGIDESTLRKRLKSGCGVEKLGRYRSVFSEDMETQLVQHCKELDNRFYGITFKTLRKIAYEYAVLNNIKNPFNSDLKLAGRDWAFNFIKKYNLSLRTPTNTSLARMMGFNEVQINVFFENLTQLYKKFNFPPSSIYNMDESGISTVPNKIPRIISSRGKKNVGKISSAERGQLVTIICAMSAAGGFVPPAIIFPRKRLKNELLDGAPPESIAMCSDSGYTNTNLFVEWLKHFRSKVRPDQEHPVLLIMDNHSSHESLEAVNYCRENFIHMLTIPPHSSHRIQPLDRCYFKALKTFYADECDRWLTTNPGRQITHFQVARLLAKAYERCSTMNRGVKGFEVCGIYPINRNVFTEEDFLPSNVTDKEADRTLQGADKNSSDSGTESDDVPLIHYLPSTSGTYKNHVRGTNEQSTSGTNKNQFNQIKAPHMEVMSKDNAFVTEISQTPLTPEKSSTSTQNTIKIIVSPKDIIPFPKRKEEQKRRRQGKKSKILSSSPNKEKLEAMAEEKVRKESLKSCRNAIKHKIIGKTADQPKTKKTKISKCPGCNEVYEDPPFEDWIMCCYCKQWWHECCTSYEKIGSFKCDLCL